METQTANHFPESAQDIPEILIAEDNPDNYKLFEILLQKSYHLVHAWNGAEAIRLFEKHHPMLIIMDIKMPEVDGYEATRAIRNQSASIPIIAVTACAFTEEIKCILSSGFNDYISKPLNSIELKNKIRQYLAQK